MSHNGHAVNNVVASTVCTDTDSQEKNLHIKLEVI